MPDPNYPIARDLARSGLYRLLALGFRYPEPGSVAEFQRVRDLLREGSWPFPHLERDVPPLAMPPADELSGDYLRLFDRKVECSPYESEYGMGNRAFTKSRDLADIAGFYKAFGLDLGEQTTDLYDHVAVELEFMSVLALKEAYARHEGHEDGLDVTRGAAASFLREHLGRWVPSFCDKLEEAAEVPFYRQLAALTRSVVIAECAHYDVEPIPLTRAIGPAIDDDRESAMVCPKAT